MHEQFREETEDLLLRGRKNNSVIILVTQEPEHLLEAYPVVPGSSRFSVWAGWLPRLARGLNRPVGSPLPSYAAVAGIEPWRRRCEGWHGR